MSQPTPDQGLLLALQHLQGGRLADAEALCRQILVQYPNHAGGLHLLGVLASKQGRYEVALDLMRRALALQPDSAQIQNNLGFVLQAAGKTDEAIAILRQAVTHQPDYFDAHFNLGVALQCCNRYEEAIVSFQRCLALCPSHADTFNNLGSALCSLRRFEAAVAAYRSTLQCRGEYAEAWNNLGNALTELGRHEEAITASRRALQLRPDYAEAHFNLGIALHAHGQLDAAVASYQQALTCRSDYVNALINLGGVYKDEGLLDLAIATFRTALQIKPDSAQNHSNLVYTLHFHPDYDAHEILREHLRWNQQHAIPLTHLQRPHSNDRSPDRRLRIGYVSPDLRAHVVGRFLLPLLAATDHGSSEIFCYADVLTPDAITERLHSHADHWRNIVGLSDDQVAALIRQDQIDILVDLTMHMGRNRLLVFARKPAPIQVAYLAYCSTTGMDAIDYRLTDPYLDPPQGDSTCYTEQTVRLPQTYWCYAPDADPPPSVNDLPALVTSGVTFGCFNNFCKVSEPSLATWAQILQSLPASRLILHAQPGSHRDRAAGFLANLGIDPSRLEFVGFLPMLEYFRLHQRIDLALDPFPYSGGTTSCDALWMGVPIITLAGRTAVGRGGVSILSNLNLPELIAHTPEQFVQIATDLAKDLPRLADLRATLRSRMQASPLMDAPKFARAIESAYRTMWRRFCSSPAKTPAPTTPYP